MLRTLRTFNIGASRITRTIFTLLENIGGGVPRKIWKGNLMGCIWPTNPANVTNRQKITRKVDIPTRKKGIIKPKIVVTKDQSKMEIPEAGNQSLCPHIFILRCTMIVECPRHKSPKLLASTTSQNRVQEEVNPSNCTKVLI